MSDPVSPTLLTTLATAIEAATPPSWRAKPLFRRVRAATPQGVDEALPATDDPTRNRLFNIVVESAQTSAKMTSDEDRCVLDLVLLIRIYYAEFVTLPGEGAAALLEARAKLADWVVLYRAVILANIFAGPISGASSIVDAGAVFPPGLIEWRLNVTMEELNV